MLGDKILAKSIVLDKLGTRGLTRGVKNLPASIGNLIKIFNF